MVEEVGLLGEVSALFSLEESFSLPERLVWETIPVDKLKDLVDEPMGKFSCIRLKEEGIFVIIKGHEVNVTSICEIAFTPKI